MIAFHHSQVMMDFFSLTEQRESISETIVMTGANLQVNVWLDMMLDTPLLPTPYGVMFRNMLNYVPYFAKQESYHVCMNFHDG